MAISGNILSNGISAFFNTYGLLPLERINVGFGSPTLLNGCTFSEEVIITELPQTEGVILKYGIDLEVVQGNAYNVSEFPHIYLEISDAEFNADYSFKFQYVGSCGESQEVIYKARFVPNDLISVPQFSLPNVARGEIVSDIIFPNSTSVGNCAFVSYQFISVPPANVGVFKKNGSVITTATTFTNADTISLEILSNAPFGSIDLRYKANGQCTLSDEAQIVFFVADAPAMPSMISQTPIYLGEQIRGSVSVDGELLVIRNGLQFASKNVVAGNWFYNPTAAGNFTFRLRNKFGTSVDSIPTVVIDPLAVIPPAPSVFTISPSSINVPILVNSKSSGTLIVFKDSVQLSTKNAVFGDNSYTPTVSGNYQFKIQNAVGTSEISSTIVVNGLTLTQSPTVDLSGSDLQLPSSFLRFNCPEAGILKIYNSLGVQIAGDFVVTAGQQYDWTVAVAGIYCATLKAANKNESLKSEPVTVNGVFVAIPVIAGLNNVVVGTVLSLTIATNGTLLVYKNGSPQSSAIVSAGTVNFTPNSIGAWNFRLQTSAGISDFSRTINVQNSISGISVVFSGVTSACDDSLEYGYHPSSDNPNNVSVWQTSNVINIPAEGEYYFFARSSNDHSIFYVSYKNTANMELYSTSEVTTINNLVPMKIKNETISLVEGIDKQISFGLLTMNDYVVELRDGQGNFISVPIPPETRNANGFIIRSDITVESVTVRVSGV